MNIEASNVWLNQDKKLILIETDNACEKIGKTLIIGKVKKNWAENNILQGLTVQFYVS